MARLQRIFYEFLTVRFSALCNCSIFLLRKVVCKTLVAHIAAMPLARTETQIVLLSCNV